MQIHKATRRTNYQRINTNVNPVTLNPSPAGDSVILSAGKGAAYAGAAGIVTVGALAVGATLLEGSSLSEAASILRFVTGVVAPASLAAGAATGALTGLGGATQKTTRNTAMGAGVVAGVGALGYGLYTAIHSMR